MLSAVFKAISRLPRRAAYALASGVAFLARDVVRYRRKVILENLRNSFPEKSDKEIRKIAREYYDFLADYFVETAAMISMSAEEMMSRMRFENIEAVERCLRRGQPVSLYLGHFGNWEWCASIPLHLSAPCEAMEVYHPLENKDADEAFLMLRSRFGGRPVAMADTLRAIVAARQKGVPSIMGYIADQSPLFESTHLFLDFLNQDTPVLTGAEKISRRIGAAAFYCDMHRLKRGQYVCKMVEISPDASREEEFELTRRYFRLLEQSIRRDPPRWLWSHRRWKRTRADFLRVYGPDAPARLARL